MKLIQRRLHEFLRCHKGLINKLLHIIGFTLIGLGILDKSLLYVLLGSGIQELGHVVQYIKTRDPKDSPFYCIKPQAYFAYPVFIAIVIYVIWA